MFLNPPVAFLNGGAKVGVFGEEKAMEGGKCGKEVLGFLKSLDSAKSKPEFRSFLRLFELKAPEK